MELVFFGVWINNCTPAIASSIFDPTNTTSSGFSIGLLIDEADWNASGPPVIYPTTTYVFPDYILQSHSCHHKALHPISHLCDQALLVKCVNQSALFGRISMLAASPYVSKNNLWYCRGLSTDPAARIRTKYSPVSSVYDHNEERV